MFVDVTLSRSSPALKPTIYIAISLRDKNIFRYASLSWMISTFLRSCNHVVYITLAIDLLDSMYSMLWQCRFMLPNHCDSLIPYPSVLFNIRSNGLYDIGSSFTKIRRFYDLL